MRRPPDPPGDDERRPRQGGETSSKSTGQAQHQDATRRRSRQRPDVVVDDVSLISADARTAAWAWRRLARHVAEAPQYASEEWLALADRDGRKVCAVILAAESWRVNVGRWHEAGEQEATALAALSERELAEAITTMKSATALVAERLDGSDPLAHVRAVRVRETARRASGYPGVAGGVHRVTWDGTWLDQAGRPVNRQSVAA